MKLRQRGSKPLLAVLALALCMLPGCGEDSDSGTGPTTETWDTHYQITVTMSSIWAQNNCENAPGNMGEFQWRLIIRTPDLLGNQVIVADTGTQHISIGDGDRPGVDMDPVTFLVPNAPDSEFQVEYWVGEYDSGDADFERHSWATHILDRGGDQQWAAGRSYEEDRYKTEEDGSGSGLYKFAVWNTRAECSGAAYYHVTWKPTTPPSATGGAS